MELETERRRRGIGKPNLLHIPVRQSAGLIFLLAPAPFLYFPGSLFPSPLVAICLGDSARTCNALRACGKAVAKCTGQTYHHVHCGCRICHPAAPTLSNLLTRSNHFYPPALEELGKWKSYSGEWDLRNVVIFQHAQVSL